MPPRARSGHADIRHTQHLATGAHRGLRLDVVGTRHDPYGEPLPPDGTSAAFPIVSGAPAQGRPPKGWARHAADPTRVEAKAPILDVEGFKHSVSRAMHRAVEAADKLLGVPVTTTVRPLAPRRGEVSRHEVHVDVAGRASATHHVIHHAGRGWKHEGGGWSRTLVSQKPETSPWVRSADDAASHGAALEGAVEKIIADVIGEETLTDTGIEALAALL